MHVRKASKIIWAGKEGSGKSLKMAHTANIVLGDNIYWCKITGIPRPIYTNIIFSDEFKARALKGGIPVIEWKNLKKLVGVSGADIFIDEIGIYFDSRLWADLPLAVRHWIAQCDKNGVNLYGTAQGFDQVEKSFRRLVTKLYLCRKLVGSSRPHVSYPVIKFPWGLFFTRDVEPTGYKADSVDIKAYGMPHPFFLHKSDYGVYSTNQRVDYEIEHIVEHILQKCEDPACTWTHIKHV